jgi:hypothetical protein
MCGLRHVKETNKHRKYQSNYSVCVNLRQIMFYHESFYVVRSKRKRKDHQRTIAMGGIRKIQIEASSSVKLGTEGFSLPSCSHAHSS